MARTALFSPSVLSSAASGYRLPSLQVVRAFVSACGGDVEEWERRWHALAQVSPRMPNGGARGGGDALSQAPPEPPSSNAGGRYPPWSGAPSQLPPAALELVGRDLELRRARELLGLPGAGASPLVVSGHIGVGKSALALHLAHQLAPESVDGQLYADLGSPAAGDGSGVVTGFLSALGVPRHRLPEESDHRAALFRSLLVQRSLLVVLDNAGEERQVRPLLARSRSSRIIVTSRRPMLGLDGVRRMDIDVLRREESLALLGSWAGEQRVRAEREAAERIAELCADLPLALSIVARRCAAARWPLPWAVEQLEDPYRLLAFVRAGDASLRDHLAAACALVPPLARLVLYQLARRGVRARAETLAEWLGRDAGVIQEMIELLVDAGLLHHAAVPGCYRVPSLVGAFAFVQESEASHFVRLPRRPRTGRPPGDVSTNGARTNGVRTNGARTNGARRRGA